MTKEPNNNKQRIQSLYQRYMDNKLSKEELDEMLDTMSLQDMEEYISTPLKSTWQPENMEVDSINEKGTRKRKYYMWSAAASLLLIVGSVVFFLSSDQQFIEYHTGDAQTKEIILSDGSKVLLNANSSIKWLEDWEEKGIRQIEMTGEAYFNIAHMDHHPLQVSSPNTKIEVLGTSFNVLEGNNGPEVYLYEGKIKLNLKTNIETEEIIMERGDFVKYTKENQLLTRQVDIERGEAASWTKGELRYNDQPLGLILKDLSRIYGKEFVVQDSSLSNIPMNVGLPYANWEVMTTALELALSIELIEQENTIIVREKK